MSDATKAMRDFLTKSPSVVFPDEVMELFVPVEKENEMLREQANFEHFQLGEMKRAAVGMLDEFGALTNGTARLVAENERLYELIKKVWKWEKNGCYECPLEKDCKVLFIYDGDCGMAIEIKKGMRELGIEVGE